MAGDGSEIESPGGGPPEIALRIPGLWSAPKVLDRALPAGHRLTPGWLHLPNGSRVEVIPLPADEDFPSIFAVACRGCPSPQERRAVGCATVTIGLCGRGGTPAAARRMALAAAAVLRAGGAGVFVDNSAIALGAGEWLELATRREDRGLLRAYVAVFRGDRELWSLGMHVFGHRDAAIPRGDDDEADCSTIDSFLGMLLTPGATVAEGGPFTDDRARRFRVRAAGAAPRFSPGSPAHNPYGRWELERGQGR